MNKTQTVSRGTRLASLLLVLVMVFAMLPVGAFAAGESLKVTNAAGQETDTFTVGEPIYVTASSASASEWVGFYDLNYPTTSAFWYYVSYANGVAYNVYDGEFNNGWEGWMMEPDSTGNRYVIRLVEAGLSKTIKIVAPDDDSVHSLTVEKTTVNYNEPIKVTAEAYGNYAWVGLYKGHTDRNTAYGTSEQYYNMTGHVGVEQKFTVTAGNPEYSVVLFGDGGKTNVLDVVHITVTQPEGGVTEPEAPEQGEGILSTDKQSYSLGEAIQVTVDTAKHTLGAKDWIGIWKEGETVGEGATDSVSLYYYYPSSSGVTNNMFASGNVKQRDDLTAGTYVIRLLKDDGYEVLDAVTVTIGAKEAVSSETVPPTCEEKGYTLVTYSDGSTEKTNFVSAKGHAYGNKLTCIEGQRKHGYICANDPNHVKDLEKCSFGEGSTVVAPDGDTPGSKKFTCSGCGGSYTEPFFDLPETGRDVSEPTCEEPGTLTIYYEGGKQVTQTTPALGHAYPDSWTFDEENRKHTKVCANDASHVLGGDCQMTLDAYEGSDTRLTCSVCENSVTVPMLTTDKNSYAFGDPIMVTTQYQGNKSWIGMYKKGEPHNGDKKSIFWNWTGDLGNTQQINLPINDENGRTNDYKAGEFTIVLYADEGYSVKATKDILIGKVLDESKTVTVDPTCEVAGKVIYTYTDGSTETVEKPALGHAYSEGWTFDESTWTHYHICANDNTHRGSLTKCDFDEGKVVLSAEGDAPGLKRFSCNVCGGSYVEPYMDKAIESEEMVVAPTCETKGTLRRTYVGGITLELDRPMLGHKFPEKWTFDAANLLHVKVCENDDQHVTRAKCSFGDGVVGNNVIMYTCAVCGGRHASSLMSTDKDVYEIGEPIMVTAHNSIDGSWVGLYQKGEVPGPDIKSIYWYYVVSKADGIDRNGQTINLASDNYYNTERGEGLTEGEYTVILFRDGDYDEIATKDITLVEGSVKSTYDFTLNGKQYNDGDHATFPEGTAITINATAEGHVGSSWVGIYYNRVSTDVDFTGVTSNHWYYVADQNGANVTYNFPAGIYSVVIFADGGYSRPMKCVTFSIEKDRLNSQVLVKPNCVDFGVELITYEDDSQEYKPIDPLGHDFTKGSWTYNADDRTHTMPCDRCSDVVTYACYFGEGEILKQATATTPGEKRFICHTCGGTYTAPYTLNEEKPTAVSRLYGDTRFETAFGIADQLKENLGVEKFDTVILASGKEFADALSGSYLAKVKKAPILLCYNDTYNAKAVEYVRNNLEEGGRVYILGGQNAVSGSVEDMLKQAGVTNIRRLAGANRFDTNLMILQETGFDGEELIVCTGTNFADVLSASAVDKPVLMVYKELFANQMAWLNTLELSKIYIIGGQNAINYNLESQLRTYAPTMRLGGSTRFETSVIIAERFFTDPATAVLTYGLKFPDGLCGGILAGSMKAPVILTHERWASDAENYALENNVYSGIVLGGDGLISDSLVKSIFRMAEDNSIQINHTK